MFFQTYESRFLLPVSFNKVVVVAMELAYEQDFYLHKPIDLIILQSVSCVSKSQRVTTDIGTSIF